MNFYIINGPNLNLLGKREVEIYGDRTFEDFFDELIKRFPDHHLQYYQSNHEGDLIDKLHAVGFEADGIVLNAGAYTHTSIALRDAIAGISAPVFEVHISNLAKRESFRQHSYIKEVCVGSLDGMGFEGYAVALEELAASSAL